MNDSVLMGIVQGGSNLLGDPERLLDAQLFLAIDLVAQSISFDVRRDEEQEAVRLSGSWSGRI